MVFYPLSKVVFGAMGPSAAPGRLLQVASPTPLACPHPRPCLMGPWCICLAHIYPSLYPSSLHTSPPDIDPQRRWFYYLPYFFQNSPLNQRFIDHKYATIPLNIRPFAPLESAILFLMGPSWGHGPISCPWAIAPVFASPSPTSQALGPWGHQLDGALALVLQALK